MRSSFLPKCQPNILRISALPSNKLQRQKSLIFFIHSEFNWPLGGQKNQNLVNVLCEQPPTPLSTACPLFLKHFFRTSSFLVLFFFQGLSGGAWSPDIEVQRLWVCFFHQESWGRECHRPNEWPMARIEVNSHKLGNEETALEQKWR